MRKKSSVLSHSDVSTIVSDVIDPTCGAVQAVLQKKKADSEQRKCPSSIILEELGMAQDKNGVRTLQKMIREERETCPIVTGGKGEGYWIADPTTPQGRADLTRCIGTYSKRGGNTFVTVRRLKRFLRNPIGQTQISEDLEA